MYKRLLFISIVLVSLFIPVIINLYFISVNPYFKTAAVNMHNKTFTAGEIYGQIYDKDFLPLIYNTSETVELNGLEFEIPIKLAENQSAQHIIGYDIDGEGVTGLLSSYNNFLRNYRQRFSAIFEVDGRGNILLGVEPVIAVDEEVTAGVVTSIDTRFQKICEEAAKKMEKGAIVVMDVGTGEIRAMVSVPVYSPYDLSAALGDDNLPFINRALRAYSVGSCFKLVIAAEAMSEGFSEFEYECTGVEYVGDRAFHCHNWAGHGLQNMEGAIGNSCNTYFIALSRLLSTEKLLNTAKAFGFGEEYILANGIASVSGNIPTIKQLNIPAELANFSFGQGLLTATPVQVCAMTCAIANGGIQVNPTLIRGITLDGKSLEENEKNFYVVNRVIDNSIAKKLQEHMKAAVYNNPLSNAKTIYTVTSAKTSTAETGRYDDNSSQLYNAWITGFFPPYKPEFAVTVLCEDGGYGNAVAAPILKEIIDAYAKKE